MPDPHIANKQHETAEVSGTYPVFRAVLLFYRSFSKKVYGKYKICEQKKDIIEMKLRAITENHLYSKAYARGKKFVGRCVVVYVMTDYAAAKLARANPLKVKINRVGITVTKKLGGAVVRNRAKRIIREGYRLCDKKTPVRRGNLIVIVARQSIVDAKSADVERDLEKAFSNLGMFTK